MVEKLKKILEKIEKEKGKVDLLALLKMDDLIDKWTIVFSATWATIQNRDEVFNMIRNYILTDFSPEEVNEIAKISIFSKDEHLVEELLKYKSGATFSNQPVNGNMVHVAEIIKST
ncbi:MAG: hypothetical protein WC793_00510 [Candidatus Paceibacterota bacterium]|jgi:hypothetical protein